MTGIHAQSLGQGTPSPLVSFVQSLCLAASTAVFKAPAHAPVPTQLNIFFEIRGLGVSWPFSPFHLSSFVSVPPKQQPWLAAALAPRLCPYLGITYQYLTVGGYSVR